MGDKWDYQLRKVEIAWEIAKIRLNTERSAGAATSREHFKKIVTEALVDSWEMVDNTFPRCD